MSFKQYDALVIGAGVAGLRVADLLQSRGKSVLVIEKSKGPSGRLSSKRSPVGSIDMGAQYFHANTSSFQSFLSTYIEDGLVGTWEYEHASKDSLPNYCSIPRMTSMTRALSQNLTLLTEHRAESLEKHDGGNWLVTCDNGAKVSARTVIVATPSPQAVPLLAAMPHFQKKVSALQFIPNWTVLLGFETSLKASIIAEAPDHKALAWIANNSAKPNREQGTEAWVIQATDAWSEAHVDADKETVIKALTQSFFSYVKDKGVQEKTPIYVHGHRWLYSRVKDPLGDAFLWCKENAIGVCGDWCLGKTVESAFLSANQLGQAILVEES